MFLLFIATSLIHSLEIHAFSSKAPTSSPARYIKRSSLAPVALDGVSVENMPWESTIRIRAAVYQPPKTDDNPLPGEENNPLTILTEIASVLQMASRCEIDLVQFPEYFLNGGTFESVVSRKSAPFDRDSSTLNIVGNLCAELKVACILGYVEKEHKSEISPGKGDTMTLGCYNSLALFNADGSRAGNYRCVNPQDHSRSEDQEAPDNDSSLTTILKKGHPMIEIIPITLQLADRELLPSLQQSITLQDTEETPAKTISSKRKLKIGALCGGDLLAPEHSRHLTRTGAELLAVAGSVTNKNSRQQTGDKVLKCVLPTRSMENDIPLLFSNYVNDEANDDTVEEGPFLGQSVIVSNYGDELVRAPSSTHGDMPSSEGYFLPCEEARKGAALYAADLNVSVYNTSINNQLHSWNNRRDASVTEWDLAPTPTTTTTGNTKMDPTSALEKGKNPGNKHQAKGFGKEVVELLEQQKKTKR